MSGLIQLLFDYTKSWGLPQYKVVGFALIGISVLALSIGSQVDKVPSGSGMQLPARVGLGIMAAASVASGALGLLVAFAQYHWNVQQWYTTPATVAFLAIGAVIVGIASMVKAFRPAAA
jgi:hypothetical protein